MQDTSLAVMTFLLNALWQVPVFALVALVCDVLLGRAPARYRHRIWLIALMLSVALPIWSVRTSLGVHTGASMTAGTQAEAVAVQSGAFTALESLQTGMIPFPVAAVAFSPLVLDVALGGYAWLLLYRTLRMWRGWRKAAEIRRTAFERDLGPVLGSIVAQCKRTFGLGSVPVMCSRDIVGPLTMSTLAPVVVLPEQIVSVTSRDLLASIVGHEMAHVRRLDFARNILYEALYALIAFHPVAWLIKRRIDSTREQACDDMVTEQLVSPAAYAQSLVAIAASMTGTGRSGYALGIFQGGALEDRLRRLVDRRARVSARRAGVVFALAAAMWVVIASGTSTFSLSASQSAPASATATERELVGTWRGNWEEVLVPKFKADADSSPIWLRFEIKDGRLSGTVWHDAVDLIDQQGSNVKILHVLPKSAIGPMFEIAINGNTVSFKERRFGDVFEFQLEVRQQGQAVLHVKEPPTPAGNQEFRPWLTLTKK